MILEMVVVMVCFNLLVYPSTRSCSISFLHIGTHVAGIIGGKHYGVAKNVTLVGVQVLQPNGKGSVSNFLGGINWVVEQEKNHTRPAIINLSLGLPKSNVRSKALAQGKVI